VDGGASLVESPMALVMQGAITEAAEASQLRLVFLSERAISEISEGF
jgi:hypothetical protein